MALTKLREKLKPFNGKKTTIKGTVFSIEIIPLKNQERAKVLLKNIYLGNEYICEHIHILISPKKSKTINVGDIIKVKGIVSNYTVQKTKDRKYTIRYTNYGIKKVIYIKKLTEENINS